MTDRDIFAAAALTGLMRFTIDASTPGAYVKSTKAIAADAYDIADAMLRERERHHIPDAGKMVENTTNPTMSRDTTQSEGNVPGECTVGERLVERLSLAHMLLEDNEKLRSEIATLRKLLERLPTK